MIIVTLKSKSFLIENLVQVDLKAQALISSNIEYFAREDSYQFNIAKIALAYIVRLKFIKEVSLII